ncbi:ComEC/Rec2 family competence protein [bacterium]|nr:ComEC/Rec2 family competence protein [bacterium]
MYWENKLYLFTLFFVLGILISFGVFPLASPLIFFALSAAILLAAVAVGFYSYKRWGYIKKIPMLMAFYLLPFVLGLAFTHNALNIDRKGHILTVTGGEDLVSATVEGYVYREPEYFENRMRVYIKPLKISVNGARSKEVKKGKILLNYSFKKGKYPEFLSYGHYITFETDLKRPQKATNPGGFDYRKFLESTGVYYTAYFKDASRITPDELTKKNPFVAFSLGIKQKFLKTIRRTVKYPESAFLGGITLGLRYGMDGIFLPDARYQIKDEFKRAGVNHVLAVSGLHVTILMILFVGIFSLIGVPRRVYAVITILFLVIFAIITGGRPSTLRAVIMNSAVLMAWVLSGKGLRTSIEVGISVAALMILFVNPLLLREASFTLSFGAVLSLVLITPFLDDIFKKYLIGYTFWAACFVFASFTALIIIFKSYFFNSLFLWGFFAASGVFLYLSNKFEEKKQLAAPSYRKMPPWLISFISAQFAIQLGMMIPLSAYYFGRYPIAGMYANYIAIPLIGINVQLGMIAAILSLIPVVGIYMGLFINAANYLLLKLFIQSAHFFSTTFPYPYVKKFTFGGLIFYFIALLIIINLPYIKSKWLDYKYKLTVFKQKHDKRARIFKFLPAIIIAIVLLGSILLLIPTKRDNEVDITFFSLSKGNVVFIKTPSGRNVLINAGKHSLYNRREWDEADRVVMSILMSYGINRIDDLILTDYSQDNNSAVTTILREYPVGKVYLPTNVQKASASTYEDFLKSTDNEYLLERGQAYWVKSRYETCQKVSNTLLSSKIPYEVVKAGDYILKESKKVGSSEYVFEIYAIYPESSGKEDYFQDNMVLKADYILKKKGIEISRKQFLLAADLDRGEVDKLMSYKQYFDKVDVVLMPTRFLYNYKLKDMLNLALPMDMLFHIDYFNKGKELAQFQKDFSYLKDKAGTNFYDLSVGYVRYKIRDGKLLRFTSGNSSGDMEIADLQHEF